MPIDNQLGNLLSIDSLILIKSFLILFLVFYVVFAAILYRQVQIMNKKLLSSLSPILKFVAAVHIGISLAILFLVIGSF